MRTKPFFSPYSCAGLWRKSFLGEVFKCISIIFIFLLNASKSVDNYLSGT